MTSDRGRRLPSRGRRALQTCIVQPLIVPIALPVPDRREVAARVSTAVRLLSRHLRVARRDRGRLDDTAVARAIRQTFEELGGTFTKFGQLVASSPSLFGDTVAAEFRSCLDSAPPVPFLEVRRAIEADLGAPIDELFATIERQPVAAASLAVVHLATLHDGREVAVKVLRPGVERRIATDLAVLRPLFKFVSRQVAVGIAGAFHGLVVGLELQISEELDLANEARSSQWFEEVLEGAGAKYLVVPSIVPERSGRRVLTMDRIVGVPIDDPDAIAALGVDPAPLVLECLRIWFGATLATGAFHGDIHAGNILVRPDGRAALLDWGIVGRLDDETAAFFRRMIEAVLGDESAWVEIAAHIEQTYGSGLKEILGFDDDAMVAFVRSQMEPVFCQPFGSIDLRMLVQASGPGDDGVAPIVKGKSTRELVKLWWVERKRQQVLMDMPGYGGGFDQATFLLSKQLVYFERYGKLYIPDTPLIDDPDAFRDLLAATA